MARGETSSFSGNQVLAHVDDLDRFVRTAAKGDRFTYCEAAALIASETSARVRDLAAEGLVDPFRTRRAGGGWTFGVERTGKGQAVKLDPVAIALANPATDLIFRALKRAANFATPCPTDEELKRLAGLSMRQQASQHVRKLIDAKLIESQVIYERGVPSRVVTIIAGRHAGTAGGRSTALPVKRPMPAGAGR